MKRALPAVCVVLACAGPVLADDFAPPPWRGGPLSSMAEWEFATPPLPADWHYIVPEVEHSVGDGIHEMYPSYWFTNHADCSYAEDWSWRPGDGDGELFNVNPLGRDIVFDLPNWMDNEPNKLIRVQITWTGQFAPAVVDVRGYIGYLPERVEYLGSPLGTGSPAVGHIVSDWQIVPNPWWEYVAIHVPQGTGLDQVVIDTISPEPATLSVLAIGALALLRRRHR